MLSNKFIIGLIIFLLSILTLYFTRPHTKNILLYRLTRGKIQQTVVAVGQIEPYRITEVRSQISGTVSHVFFQEGDYVHEGDKLLAISPRPTPADLAAVIANESKQLTLLNQAKSSYSRYKILYDKGMISKEQFGEEESNYKLKKTNYQLAVQEFKLIKTGTASAVGKIADNVIQSPAKGYILKSYISLGDSIVPVTQYQSGTVLFVLADMKQLMFRGIVSQTDVLKLFNNMLGKIQLLADPTLHIYGSLSKIGLIAATTQNQNFQNQATDSLFDTPNSYSNGYPIEIYPLIIHAKIKLRAGMQATATFITKNLSNVLIIPIGLLHFHHEQPYVYVDTNGYLKQKNIKLGISDGSFVQVLSGLNIGDKIKE